MSNGFPSSFGDKLIELPEPIYQQMWQIVKEVAESQPDVASEVDGSPFCFYCGNDVYDTSPPKVMVGTFPHNPDCLHVKARALIAQKKEG